MFGKIAGFEFRYQVRQPIFWITALIFFLLVFGSVAIDVVRIGSAGNIHKNAPSAIGQTLLIMSVFFMFASTAFVANVIVRDDETGYGPIVRSTRLTKFDYLFGRFTGAFGAIALAFAAAPLAIYAGSVMPWVDGELMGPNRPEYYLFAYFWLALPALFLSSAIFFTLATVTRSMMATYLGVAGFLVIYVVMNVLLRNAEQRQLAAYIEPFGLAAYGLATRYFTAAEANSMVPPIQGALLWHHLIWTSVALAVLGLSWLTFRFEAPAAKLGRPKRDAVFSPPKLREGPLPAPRFDAATGWAQLISRSRLEMAQVFRSPAYIVLLLLGLFNSVGALIASASPDDASVYPVTKWVIEVLNGSFGFVVLVIAIYYAGELVWRERERKTHEIIDATALPDWAFLVPKTVAIILVMLSTLLVSVVAGIGVQLGKGFDDLQLGHYLVWYVLPSAVDWTLIAILSVFCQAISPHKFIGWGLMVLFQIFLLVATQLGYEHNLYLYGGYPSVPLSDMNAQGDHWVFAAWFRAYWSAIATVLLVLSYGLWRRGTETRLWPRLRRLPRRMASPAGAIGGIGLMTALGIGAFIYTNTNVWNEYRTDRQDEAWQADFEKTLLKYEALPQPSVTDVKLDLDLDPHAPRLVSTGAYALVNDTAAPLSSVHVRLDRDVKVRSLAVTGAHVARSFDRFNYRIYDFDRPLQPGERATLTFETVLAQRGFKNRGNMRRLNDNGTFVDNFEFAPTIGMNRNGVLQDRAKRRKFGLPAQLRPPKLEDRSAQQRNYLSNADWVNSDITVTTVGDQIPVAPGYQVSDTTQNGRRTIRYRSDAPILNFFSVQSARYEVRKLNHKGVELAVYYDRQHPWNVDRMLKALQVGLDYYQANFGPYQFRQARILEFPDYAQFAQSFANTMPYSEGIGFIDDNTRPDKIDFVTYVTAHELAHQWWAHQIIGADMQGGTALSETLAQYSALIVMEKIYGQDQIRRFLKRELDTYLRARGGELVEELPLIRVENQPYIHYRKGSLVMYLLRDQIGEDKVNAALRRLLAQYAFKGAPYPRSQDLVDALRAEAGPEHQQLITDLFEKITLYDVATKVAKVSRRSDGRYDVALTVTARKLYADGTGKEREVTLSEPFDVGVFMAEPGKKGFEARDVLSLQPQILKSGTRTLHVIVDRAPKFAGADPYNKRIDRNSDDNVIKVE